MDRPSLWGQPKEEKKFFGSFMKFYIVLLLIFVAFVVGLLSGRQSYKVVTDSTVTEPDGKVYNKKVEPEFLAKDVNFRLFWDAWKIIEDNYVKQPVSESKLFYGAIAGSVAALGDPHTIFFDPETNEKFNQELGGSFEGIGAEVAIKKEQLVIVAPLPDSPAEKSGLKSGDKIYAIDGADTAGMSLDYAVSLIRGPRGSEVILSVARDGLDEIKEYKITRQKIQIQSVKWKMLDNNIAYLELRAFNEDTAADFNKSVMAIVAKNPKGIVFDLRNNPGGLLDTAIGVVSEWIDGKTVVFEKYSDGRLEEHKAVNTPRFKDFPTVVLINGGSASGSEIVAGALKDYKIATLVGEKSFGKGSVQSLFPLDDGSAIKLTIAQWLTPNENMIDGEGINPDVEIKLTDEDFSNDKDPQLDKAVEILQARIK